MRSVFLDKDKIPYDLVTKKLNEWYTSIKNDQVEKAEIIKTEVEKELLNMEENQDALLYYQLLEFRHEIMLSYMNSKEIEDLHNAYETIKEIEKQGQLTGMLEYYFYFFKGMYEFRRKELTTAISAYRIAESKLSEVEDEIEKAEFFFKVSYVYYYMKQTYFSMNYANRALKIFREYEEYAVQTVRCQFIVAGNLIDSLEYERALEQFLNSLEISKESNIDHLIAMSHMNIGICYDELKEYKKASQHLILALEIFEKSKHSFLTKTLFTLTYVEAKQQNYDVALTYFRKGRLIADKSDDKEYSAKFKILEGLFFSDGENQLIKNAFSYLTSRKMFADVENFSIEVADYFHEQGNLMLSNEYYRMSIEARRKIKKGEIINENQPDSIGSSDFR
ncbi:MULTISPECIES: response regulator aspartate phosphatase RapI [Bacillus subtilis group]|uniref:response regulator aspartate phosphatase RapI n=1 Tax=Bacillus subtilis group TaxID=653685 RepID=UPI00100A04E1|nr:MULTISPECIES: response regulator aspartate phosphatase RapI [Bacillus subtilis group]QXG62046.1 response regulator aspartate phosphatase RapI [Bacillus spizizenii]MCY8493182.1 response regulator aspartate phosphatase RapI [Bacillus inaquosorum]MDN4184929.1 response regulator aspartate phosphatase RapI [Bacillus subtilis]QAW44580.1 tetratricopeptide repeat protein [Bacillus subtilis]UXP20149.1 response regulator aspartate phosphatase RapI [Bacillus subtilis]